MAGPDPPPGANLYRGRRPPSAKSCPELGKTFLDGLRQHATDNHVKLEGLPDDPNVAIPPEQIITVLRGALALYFPLLAPP